LRNKQQGEEQAELIINTLGKQYRGNVWGLKDFSLKVAPGILGLLGPNGAEKLTLMKILATTTRPIGGSVFWNSVDIIHKPYGLRHVLGYLP
jgi:ABC-type multidrug transport system ATPase subunit